MKQAMIKRIKAISYSYTIIVGIVITVMSPPAVLKLLPNYDNFNFIR
jgi:hypothetical protein